MGDFADDMYETGNQAQVEEPENRLWPDKVETLNLGTLWVHGETECMGPHCVIHNPSDHPLKDAPLNWRPDRGIMERICDHGVGHPDQDDTAYRKLMGLNDSDGIHGCCHENCCSERGAA